MSHDIGEMILLSKLISASSNMMPSRTSLTDEQKNWLFEHTRGVFRGEDVRRKFELKFHRSQSLFGGFSL